MYHYVVLAITNAEVLIFFQEHAKDIVRERGLPQITVDDLVKEITPRGRRKLIGIFKLLNIMFKFIFLYFIHTLLQCAVFLRSL